MKIVVDENIAFSRDYFAALGELVFLPGRSMRAEDLHDADILLVRSVTQVDEALLAGSSVRFVGSCTIGMDHVGNHQNTHVRPLQFRRRARRPERPAWVPVFVRPR